MSDIDRGRPNPLDPLDADWFKGRSRLTPTRDRERAAKRFQMDHATAEAVHAALMLGEPLLVTGEPGTGKTTLAAHLAYKLDTKLFEFNTQSISTARDLRYTYDELRRFREAWRARSGEAPDEGPARYIDPGPLWQAIEYANAQRRPPVLLIDEIDKAPRDFPNDLLNDLDQMRFTVPELAGRLVELNPDAADARPVLVITSNEERELPKPFLRRCLFLRLHFDREVIRRAVAARAEELGSPAPSFVELVIERVMALRGGTLRKPPTTSEVLMWMRALRYYGITEEQLKRAERGSLPLVELLIKHPADRRELLGRD